jgi:hypothetical protein
MNEIISAYEQGVDDGFFVGQRMTRMLAMNSVPHTGAAMTTGCGCIAKL